MAMASMPGAVGATSVTRIVQAWGIAMEKYVDQCCSFEHTAVINRQPVGSFEDGCYVSILSLFVTICARVF